MDVWCSIWEFWLSLLVGMGVWSEYVPVVSLCVFGSVVWVCLRVMCVSFLTFVLESLQLLKSGMIRFLVGLTHHVRYLFVFFFFWKIL